MPPSASAAGATNSSMYSSSLKLNSSGGVIAAGGLVWCAPCDARRFWIGNAPGLESEDGGSLPVFLRFFKPSWPWTPLASTVSCSFLTSWLSLQMSPSVSASEAIASFLNSSSSSKKGLFDMAVAGLSLPEPSGARGSWTWNAPGLESGEGGSFPFSLRVLIPFWSCTVWACSTRPGLLSTT